MPCRMPPDAVPRAGPDAVPPAPGRSHVPARRRPRTRGRPQVGTSGRSDGTPVPWVPRVTATTLATAVTGLHRQGRVMVISAPPATVPPVALLPISTRRGRQPGAARLDDATGSSSGDTLIGIAARYRTTVGVHRRPQRDPRPAQHHGRHRAQRAAHLGAARGPPPRPGSGSRVHVVRSGDTLSGIAARYDVPARLAAQDQPPLGPLVHPPRPEDRVRGAASTAAAPHGSAATTSYRVRAGDTLGSIALRHHTTVAAIARASKDLEPGPDPPGPGAARCPGKAKVDRAVLGARHLQRCHVPARRRRGRCPQPGDPRPALGAEPQRDQGDDRAHRRATAVDPRLALAIAYQESGWNQRAVSPANAVGVMQVIPQAGALGVRASSVAAWTCSRPRTTSPPAWSCCGRWAADEQHGGDRRGLLPGPRRPAEARDVHRHQAVRPHRHGAAQDHVMHRRGGDGHRVRNYVHSYGVIHRRRAHRAHPRRALPSAPSASPTAGWPPSTSPSTSGSTARSR